MANFHTPYENEREGQMEFFDNYAIQYNDDAAILADNTDGVYNGNIFEFKLTINNLNKTLFQVIKYLSKMRVKGKSIPATILLIDLNATTVYVYKSQDYKNDIHKIYAGAASKNNEGFVTGKYDYMLNYSNTAQSAQLRKILKAKKIDPDEMYMPIDIDENCIVGWAERYYRERPKASKGDFLGDDTGTAIKVTGEIRNPRHFKGLINPYKGKSNEKFKYLMDCLNDRLSKKDLGAFYTPIPYAKKAAELVQMAVDRIPDGNDYIILDRCAGTGNLECALIGLKDKNGDDLISHCVVSTYEYYEYKVLQERIGSDVREIIPPTEANVNYENGRVANADAMSEDFINNPIIKQYIDNTKCSVILFENPPYRDGVADNTNNAVYKTHKDFVFEAMKADLTLLPNSNISTARDLTNRFIWSGYKFYLRQPTDSYVLFSPIKYWKSLGLSDKVYIKGYIFNREHFHATKSAISCILWSYENDTVNENILLEAIDIVNLNAEAVANIVCKKCHKTFEVFYDRRRFSGDVEGSHFEADGTMVSGRKCDGIAIYNDNIVAYLRPTGFSIDAKHISLVKGALFNVRGFYVRNDNYKEKLPLFVAKIFEQSTFYNRDVYFTTADGGDAYTKDENFLKSCLIYTCLSNQNKCLSFDGSDGRRYQNELCFDDKALALKDLKKYETNKKIALDKEEQKLLELWNKIIYEAKKTKNYNPDFNYGVYQIKKELNTSKIVGAGKNKKKVYDYPILNGYLDTLRTMLKIYYKSHITEKMFEYELLK